MADHLPSDPGVAALAAKGLALLPGFAGAVLSLAFVDKLTLRGRILTVAVGMGAAAFIAPALVDIAALHWPDMPKSVWSAMQFMVGLLAMGVLPVVLDTARKVAGDPLSLIKPHQGAR